MVASDNASVESTMVNVGVDIPEFAPPEIFARVFPRE